MNRTIKQWLYPLTLLVALMILLNACTPPTSTVVSTLAPTLAPSPEPTVQLSKNSDWTPVIQTIDGYEMVKVPPGCFTMGDQVGRRDERPSHQVCLTTYYWLDRFEVTNQQYGSDGAYVGATLPRSNLTWIEARDFCQKRGGRLPTEAEWEYAARGVENLTFPWGNELNAANLAYDRNMTNNTPVAVGTYPQGASWVGAQDMAGNVWEWVNSVYLPYPYVADEARENITDTTKARVYRSGWLSYEDHGVSNTIRFRKAPTERDWNLGFRCALDPR